MSQLSQDNSNASLSLGQDIDEDESSGSRSSGRPLDQIWEHFRRGKKTTADH